ncbi:hypothetical protein ES708_28289 [subsurface metagenome]
MHIKTFEREGFCFKQWREEVNRYLLLKASITIRDISEKPYREYFENGDNPEEIAKKVLKEEGFSFLT